MNIVIGLSAMESLDQLTRSVRNESYVLYYRSLLSY